MSEFNIFYHNSFEARFLYLKNGNFATDVAMRVPRPPAYDDKPGLRSMKSEHL